MVDNPPAFPVSEVRNAYGQGLAEGSSGMTLRDWFAGQALPSVVSVTSAGQHHPGAVGDDRPMHQRIASDAYRLADAMLAARQTGGDGFETEAAASGTGEKLLKIAREFIDKHHVSCPEATSNDRVYEEAPLLVEQLAEVAGYYTYPEDDA